MPDPLERSICFRLDTDDSEPTIQVLRKSVDNLIVQVDQLIHNFESAVQ